MTGTCFFSRVKEIFFFQAEDGIRDLYVTGVQTCALPISEHGRIGGELVDDRRPFAGQRLARCRRQCDAAIALDEVLEEELELPRQLVDVERSEERRVGKEGRSRCANSD